jgi:hypothetical protein
MEERAVPPIWRHRCGSAYPSKPFRIVILGGRVDIGRPSPFTERSHAWIRARDRPGDCRPKHGLVHTLRAVRILRRSPGSLASSSWPAGFRLRAVAAVCVVACARLAWRPSPSRRTCAGATGQGHVTIVNMRLLPPVLYERIVFNDGLSGAADHRPEDAKRDARGSYIRDASRCSLAQIAHVRPSSLAHSELYRRVRATRRHGCGLHGRPGPVRLNTAALDWLRAADFTLFAGGRG